jgi:hypothetical protein
MYTLWIDYPLLQTIGKTCKLFEEVNCTSFLGLIETWCSLHFIEVYNQSTISVLSPRQQKPLFRSEHNGPGHLISAMHHNEKLKFS